MKRSVICALLMAASISRATAGELVVTVTTPDGKPLPDAVITLPAPAGTPVPAFPWKQEIAQKDRQFAPFVLITPVGAEVEFPNFDKFRHHVYSFSKGNKFELELFGREEQRKVTLKTAGTAAIGCNIHDEMVAYIRVVNTPYAAKSTADGVARIPAAPDGAGKLSVWHPHARAKDQVVVKDVVVSPAAPTRLTVVVEIAPVRAG